RVIRDGWDPAWSPDGGTIYFTRFAVHREEGTTYRIECGSIYRVGFDGRGLRRLTNPPAPGFHSHSQPAVSPDGRSIAFTDPDHCAGGITRFALRVISGAGYHTNDLAQLPGNAYSIYPEYGGPAWSPDG